MIQYFMTKFKLLLDQIGYLVCRLENGYINKRIFDLWLNRLKSLFFKNTVASYWKEGIDNFITGEEELKNLKKEVDDRKPLTRELAKNMQVLIRILVF